MEWLLSKDFIDYRKEEIKTGALFFKNILTSPNTPDYIKGASDMLRAIIKIPQEIAQSSEEKETAEIMLRMSLKEVEVHILRSVLMGE